MKKEIDELGKQLFLITANDLELFAESCAKKVIGQYFANKIENNEKLLNPQQVADILQVSVPIVQRWEKDGTLKSITIGNRKRFRMSEVQALIEKMESEEVKL